MEYLPQSATESFEKRLSNVEAVLNNPVREHSNAGEIGESVRKLGHGYNELEERIHVLETADQMKEGGTREHEKRIKALEDGRAKALALVNSPPEVQAPTHRSKTWARESSTLKSLVVDHTRSNGAVDDADDQNARSGSADTFASTSRSSHLAGFTTYELAYTLLGHLDNSDMDAELCDQLVQKLRTKQNHSLIEKKTGSELPGQLESSNPQLKRSEPGGGANIGEIPQKRQRGRPSKLGIRPGTPGVDYNASNSTTIGNRQVTGKSSISAIGDRNSIANRALSRISTGGTEKPYPKIGKFEDLDTDLSGDDMDDRQRHLSDPNNGVNREELVRRPSPVNPPLQGARVMNISTDHSFRTARGHRKKASRAPATVQVEPEVYDSEEELSIGPKQRHKDSLRGASGSLVEDSAADEASEDDIVVPPERRSERATKRPEQLLEPLSWTEANLQMKSMDRKASQPSLKRQLR